MAKHAYCIWQVEVIVDFTVSASKDERLTVGD